MKRLITAFALALTTAALLPVHAAAAPPATGGLALPISGSGSGATFTGTFTLQKFVESSGGIAAMGTLTGTVTDALGAVTTVAQNVTMPVNVAATTCAILHLDIGPISLDLLGLQVNLSRIVLDVTAQAGAGNLLGNLLCAVAGLLDQPGGLARLLNDILGIITG